MPTLTAAPLRRLAHVLGFPPGTGELIDEPTRRRLAISVGLSALLALLDMAGVVAMLPMMQYVTGQPVDEGAIGLVNRVLGEPEVRILVFVIALLIFGAFIVKDVASLIVRRWQLRFMADQQVELSTSMLEGYLTAPYWWHLRTNTSDTLWAVQGAVGMGYSGGLSSALAALTELLTITFIFGSLLVISPTVALVAGVYFGVAAYLVQRVIRPRIQAAGEESRLAGIAVSKASLEPLTAVKEVKLRRAHGQFVDDFRVASAAGADASVRAAILNAIPSYFLEVVFVLGVGVLSVVATTGSGGQGGLVLLGIFVAAGTRVLPSSVRLINAFAGVRFAHAPLGHIIGIQRAVRLHRSAEDASVVTSVDPAGDLEVAGVRFAYPDAPDIDVLRGVDLTVPHGSSLAVVGLSGAGKSTLVDLMLGLHQPTAGTIRAGGISIFDNLPGWQRRVAVVPQEVTLLDTTIRQNIAFDEVVDEDRLRVAIERAQLADLISQLPKGLDSGAGERGSRLSGGQRQRIGIARALYRDPALLVLDEATSALDNETERRITATIDSLSGDVSVVVVAHRLSTVRHCDALAFLEDGEIASYGTFDEVRSSNPTFAHLVELGALTDEVPQTDAG